MKTLSDKIIHGKVECIGGEIGVNHVKEFINELKEEFPKTEGVHAFTGEQFQFAIDKLAGEKLI